MTPDASPDMSKDKLAELANKDTPAGITVPSTWPGIMVWICSKWGGAALVAAVAFYSMGRIYEDMRTDRAQLLDAYRDNTRVIEGFAKTIEAQTRAIEGAHQRASK